MFDEQKLVDTAASVYKVIADHNPQTMGKNRACYSTLHHITSIYAQFLDSASGVPRC
jgi:hypothetical protein